MPLSAFPILRNKRRIHSVMQRKKKNLSPVVVLVAAIAVVVLIVVLVLSVGSSSSTETTGRAVRLGALSTQKVTPFGEDILYYDGTMLQCVSDSGSTRWNFQVGANAGFSAGPGRVVAWSANQIYALNDKGQNTYNNKMAGEIQFARIGSQYVAAFVGTSDTGTVYVIDKDGSSVDAISFTDQTLLDMGFFTMSDGEYLWIMGIDTSGTVISTFLQTYQPGRLVLGNATLGEQLVYKIYYTDKLYVVDTRKIRAYDYRITRDTNTDDVLIYGWYMQDIRKVGKHTYQLFVPAPASDGSLNAASLRLMWGTNDRVLHLPADCIGAYLGSKSVYAFSGTHVYSCRYGEQVFTAYTMPVQITKVLGMLQNDKVIVASGSDTYVISLPS